MEKSFLRWWQRSILNLIRWWVHQGLQKHYWNVGVVFLEGEKLGWVLVCISLKRDFSNLIFQHLREKILVVGSMSVNDFQVKWGGRIDMVVVATIYFEGKALEWF